MTVPSDAGPPGASGPPVEAVVLVVSHQAGNAIADSLAGRGGLRWHRAGPADAAEELRALLAEDDGDRRVAVVGIGGGAGAAVEAAASNGRVAALSFVGPRLEAAHVELIEEWPELPVFGVATPDHRPGLSSAVDAHLASRHPASDLRVGPVDEAALAELATWLGHRLEASARVEDVVMHSSDGWELHGTMWLPTRDDPVPGVVLLHTGRSDRAAFGRLARLLADAGLAVMNLDWRGRGESTNLGSYFDLDADTKAAAWRDAVAALDRLAAQPGVDPERLGMVGVVHGAEYAVRAAHRDPRVKALAILTGYRPAEPEEAPHLTSGHVEVLYVTSTDHTITTTAMRELYEASSGRRTQFVEYPGAAIGYQLFELDPSLEPRITGWLREVLGA